MSLSFTPDYATPPRATLRETLAAQGVTPSTAARILGLTTRQFRSLLSGRRELTADTAAQLETFTGIPTTFWIQAQSNDALHKMRLLRASLRIRPRTLTERRKRRALMRQAALATARDLQDYPESRVPDVMDLIEDREKESNL